MLLQTNENSSVCNVSKKRQINDVSLKINAVEENKCSVDETGVEESSLVSPVLEDTLSSEIIPKMTKIRVKKKTKGSFIIDKRKKGFRSEEHIDPALENVQNEKGQSQDSLVSSQNKGNDIVDKTDN